jgi:hypothetical protein
MMHWVSPGNAGRGNLRLRRFAGGTPMPNLRKPSFVGPAAMTLARRSAPVPQRDTSSHNGSARGNVRPLDDGIGHQSHVVLPASLQNLPLGAPALGAMPEPRERRRADGSLQIGPLHVSDTVLGHGSSTHGTTVFAGDLSGRPVAVKRMLVQAHLLAALQRLPLLPPALRSACRLTMCPWSQRIGRATFHVNRGRGCALTAARNARGARAVPQRRAQGV